jgi:hypothetical protein
MGNTEFGGIHFYVRLTGKGSFFEQMGGPEPVDLGSRRKSPEGVGDMPPKIRTGLGVNFC